MCFSKFAFCINGNIENLHSAKAEELIAFIACERGSVSKAKAAESLWSAANPNHAMDSLYKTLRHIRSLPFHVPIVHTRRTLQLDLFNVDLDIDEFLECCKSSDVTSWERAVEIYRGILLIDNAYEWSSMYEAFYDVRYYELLNRLAEHYKAARNKNKARYYQSKLDE